MKKINKNINVVLIFMLIVVAYPEDVFCLRNPIGIEEDRAASAKHGMLEEPLESKIEEFVKKAEVGKIVIFMDKDKTVTITSSLIDEEMLSMLVNLAVRGIYVVVITGTNFDKTDPYIIKPVEEAMESLGQKEKLKFFRFYFFSGAGGVYYNDAGERKVFIIEEECSPKDRLTMLKSYALSFLEEVQANFSINLNGPLNELSDADKSAEDIKNIFQSAIMQHSDLLGYVTLVDDPKGCILELAHSKDQRAKGTVANIDFMTKVRARYDRYVEGNLERKPIIKHGATFITTNLIDKEIVISRIAETLGIDEADLLTGGDSATDYGFLKYRGPKIRQNLAFLVGKPGAEGEPLPPDVNVSRTEGPEGTKKILERFLTYFDSKLHITPPDSYRIFPTAIEFSRIDRELTSAL